jgi:hypothetical protein
MRSSEQEDNKEQDERETKIYGQRIDAGCSEAASLKIESKYK